ncbi:DNA translocase FtsK [Patescibacteria group bacterium]
MAKSKSQSKDSNKDKSVETESVPKLSTETRHGIWAIGLFTIAALALLSFFDLAGQLGIGISDGLSLIFGWGHYLIPILLIIIGYIMLVPERARLSLATYLGLLLLILAYSGLLHLFIPVEDAVTTVAGGKGGGYAGIILSYPLQRIMGVWATLVVLLALVIIGLLIVFNTTLRQLAERGGAFARIYDVVLNIFEKLRFRWARRRQFKEHDELLEDDESFSAREITAEDIADDKEDEKGPEQLEILSGNKPAMASEKKHYKKINLPISLLDSSQSRPTSGNIDENKRIISSTLENFGISVEMGEINVGPTVTQYTLKPAEGVKLAQILTLQNDLALALAAHPIRIEAPIPGKSLVGIEVPNQSVALVSLREVMESDEYNKSTTPLSFALGKDVSGKSLAVDLDPLPHLLVAGATGSGKSVSINSIIVSLLYKNSPDRLKFIMIDPKRVELSIYNDIPHLLTPVITNVDQTVNALKWIVAEMDRRFRVLQESGKRDIHSYHRDIDDGMPYIVLVIDELADLMSVAAHEVEGAITRLAQMARAVGIHLVVATQRPSVDVITGLIKANITARIAFNVVSIVDSRTILDSGGAEKLLGRGDMLFVSSDMSKPKRLQGAFVSDKEIERVVKMLKGEGRPNYDMEVTTKPVPAPPGTIDDLDEDELLGDAQEVIMQAGKASASLLQRRLRIGYARAARILDLLEERGIIGPGEGAKPREILISTTERDDQDDSLEQDEDTAGEDEKEKQDEEERL